MAGTGKDGKEKKSGRDDSATTLRRLGEELAQLRSDLYSLRVAPAPALAAEEKPRPRAVVSGDPAGLGRHLSSQIAEPRDAAVSVGYVYQSEDENGVRFTANDVHFKSGLREILSSDDAAVARLAYAYSSAPKIAILRSLLWDGAQSAAQLGEKASLTTGSLYHHLRELTHADVIESPERNRFALTAIGRETALLLFVQAARDRDVY
jgi:hypothetical protein